VRGLPLHDVRWNSIPLKAIPQPEIIRGEATLWSNHAVGAMIDAIIQQAGEERGSAFRRWRILLPLQDEAASLVSSACMSTFFRRLRHQPVSAP
jgi:hypothetical protein